MDAEQIALVQGSFTHIHPIADTVAALFYQRLFALDTTTCMLFQGNSANQEQKFLELFWGMIQELHQPDRVWPFVQALGRRHAQYGVQCQHYVTVGIALLWALRQSLDKNFTPEVEAAWARAYAMLAEAMAEAASNARLPTDQK